MTIDEAAAKLGIRVSATSEPVITTEELKAILEDVALVDSEGRAPSDDDWEGTYEFQRATAAAFRLKAARVSHQMDFTSRTMSARRSQKAQTFLQMAMDAERGIVNSFHAIDDQADDSETFISVESD